MPAPIFRALSHNYCMAHKIPTFVSATKIRTFQSPRDRDKRFYHSAAWKRLRLMMLRRYPICQSEGCEAPSTEVHHEVDRRADPSRALDPTNLRCHCRSCHSRITRARQSGRDGP